MSTTNTTNNMDSQINRRRNYVFRRARELYHNRPDTWDRIVSDFPLVRVYLSGTKWSGMRKQSITDYFNIMNKEEIFDFLNEVISRFPRATRGTSHA